MSLGPRLHRYGTVESTQDLVHALGAAGAPHGEAVVAVEQRGGRGSRGREWESPPGGLWLSVLWRPLGGELGPLSLRVGLATAGAVERATGVAVALKWPNDLYLDDRKLGGILCEARWSGDAAPWVAIGIGINVRNPVPPGAVALMAVVADASADALITPVLDALRELERGATALSPDELTAFTTRDWLAGRALERPIPGTAAGVTPAGHLRIRRPDGTIEAVAAGTIVLAPPGATGPTPPTPRTRS